MEKYIFQCEDSLDGIFTAIYDAWSSGYINVFSQEKVAHFVFPRFEKATVLYKNNNQSNTELNYNTATEEMIYVGDAGRRMAIHPIDQIDTVYIAGRKFVPVGRAFNEVLLSGNIPLYVSYKCKMTQGGSSVGYGTSSTTAVDNISSLMGKIGRAHV